MKEEQVFLFLMRTKYPHYPRTTNYYNTYYNIERASFIYAIIEKYSLGDHFLIRLSHEGELIILIINCDYLVMNLYRNSMCHLIRQDDIIYKFQDQNRLVFLERNMSMKIWQIYPYNFKEHKKIKLYDRRGYINDFSIDDIDSILIKIKSQKFYFENEKITYEFNDISVDIYLVSGVIMVTENVKSEDVFIHYQSGMKIFYYTIISHSDFCDLIDYLCLENTEENSGILNNFGYCYKDGYEHMCPQIYESHQIGQIDFWIPILQSISKYKKKSLFK